MEYYLVRLSYTAAAMNAIVSSRDTFDQRMSKVRGLVGSLGGGFATYNFENNVSDQINFKFSPVGSDDIICIIAFKDNTTARHFQNIVSSESGVRSMEMTALVPLQNLIGNSPAKGDYFAPGAQ